MTAAIVIVDDDPNDSRMIELQLQKAKIINPLVIVESGADALDYLKAVSANTCPVLVILDLGLPDISGMDVLRAMRAQETTRLTPVLVLSGFIDFAVNLSELEPISMIRKGTDTALDIRRFFDEARALGVTWEIS